MISAEDPAWGVQIFSRIHADRRFLPFALLLLMMAWPARVLILFRKPWVRLRFVLLG
jgi:hypothetical protein